MKEEVLYDIIDKTDWHDGPWKTEPDRVFWIDKKTEYPCIIKRASTTGALCGYVGIPKNHPLFENHYGYVNVRVHGGLSYGDDCDHDPVKGICHLGDENDHRFWFGFDCAHAFDFSPAMRSFQTYTNWPEHYHGEIYRDIAYVKNEVKNLAKQLKDFENETTQFS